MILCPLIQPPEPYTASCTRKHERTSTWHLTEEPLYRVTQGGLHQFDSWSRCLWTYCGQGPPSPLTTAWNPLSLPARCGCLPLIATYHPRINPRVKLMMPADLAKQAVKECTVVANNYNPIVRQEAWYPGRRLAADRACSCAEWRRGNLAWPQHLGGWSQGEECWRGDKPAVSISLWKVVPTRKGMQHLSRWHQWLLSLQENYS